jgi:hypothetical protein
LEQGDHLTRDEFERRYDAMPTLKKAELIEGVVYMPSPVRLPEHGEPHGDMVIWLGSYKVQTKHVRLGDNATVKLDLDNEPQPDVLLFIEQIAGGQSHVDAKGYINEAPELVAEIAASSVSYDLHEKLRVYRNSGVREYIVWRVQDAAIDWFVLRGGQYVQLQPQADGLLHSEVFPGLWLDPAALTSGAMPRVLAVLQQGLASPEHQAFVAALRQKAGT